MPGQTTGENIYANDTIQQGSSGKSGGNGSNGESQTVAIIAVNWLKGQPFNNVMIVFLVAMLGYLGRVIIYDLIPGERQAIEHLVDRVEERQTKQIDRVCESFDRALDRGQFRYPGSSGSTAGVSAFGKSAVSSKD